MMISLNSSLLFLQLTLGQLPTGQDPGPHDKPKPIPLKPNPQNPIPVTPKTNTPEGFDQEAITKKLRLLTHNSLLANNLDTLLPVLRKLDRNRQNSTTDNLIKGGINLQLVPTGDGTYQSQRSSGKFSLQPQDLHGSIFVDNRGKDAHGAPLPPVTYEISGNGSLTLNNSRTKSLLWTEPLSKLKAYRNIAGAYSTYGEDYELVPQLNGSIYDKTNKRTYVKKADTWQWDVSLTKPLPTTEYITKYNLSPHPDSDGSFIEPQHSNLKCYPRNNGSLVYIGAERAGDKEKIWTSTDGNKLSLLAAGEVLLRLGAKPNTDSSWSRKDDPYYHYPSEDGSTYHFSEAHGKCKHMIVNGELRWFPEPKPILLNRNIFIDSKQCMKHNPNSPFLHGNGMPSGSGQNGFKLSLRGFDPDDQFDFLKLRTKPGEQLKPITKDEVEMLRKFLEEKK